MSGPFLIAFFVAAVGSPFVMAFLRRIGSRQTVSEHVAEHAHKQGTPTMGGLILLLGLVPALATFEFGRRLLPLVILYALIGWVDDFVIPRRMRGKRGLGWIPKLALQVAAAGIGLWFLVPSGGAWAISTPYPNVYADAGTDWTTLGLGVLVVLFASNAYNFTDGLDWLAGTVLVAILGGYLFVRPPDGATIAALALLGTVLPFLWWNRPKARVFMGDVGSMPVGALVGVFLLTLLAPSSVVSATVTVSASPQNDRFSLLSAGWTPSWIVPLLLSMILLIELVPVPLQILSVKLRKKRLFPMTPIHHAFQKAGWRETRIVALFFTIQAVCSLLAVLLSGRSR